MTAPARKPIEERGRRLATFERPDGQLRWSLDEYEGREYVSARLWTRGADGNFYPSVKGVTVRVRELGPVILALQEVQRETADVAAKREAARAEGGEAARPEWLQQWHGRQERRGR